MISILVALRDFFVAVLISWLGVADEPAGEKKADNAKPTTATAALFIQ